MFKRQQQPYVPGEWAGGWRKYRVRESTEAIVGAVTGSLHRPGTLLLGRRDAAGRIAATAPRSWPTPPWTAPAAGGTTSGRSALAVTSPRPTSRGSDRAYERPHHHPPAHRHRLSDGTRTKNDLLHSDRVPAFEPSSGAGGGPKTGSEPYPPFRVRSSRGSSRSQCSFSPAALKVSVSAMVNPWTVPG